MPGSVWVGAASGLVIGGAAGFATRARLAAGGGRGPGSGSVVAGPAAGSVVAGMTLPGAAMPGRAAGDAGALFVGAGSGAAVFGDPFASDDAAALFSGVVGGPASGVALGGAADSGGSDARAVRGADG